MEKLWYDVRYYLLLSNLKQVQLQLAFLCLYNIQPTSHFHCSPRLRLSYVYVQCIIRYQLGFDEEFLIIISPTGMPAIHYL